MERESEEKAQREAMRASESNTTEPNVRLRGVLELQYRTLKVLYLGCGYSGQ
jgi:hypothetical protein